MSSLTKAKSEEDADGFMDSSSLWMELSTSSVSAASVSYLSRIESPDGISSAPSVYFASVSSTVQCPLVVYETNLGKQVVHLSKAFGFLTLITCHKNTSIIVVDAGRADARLAVCIDPLRFPFAGLLPPKIVSKLAVLAGKGRSDI